MSCPRKRASSKVDGGEEKLKACGYSIVRSRGRRHREVGAVMRFLFACLLLVGGLGSAEAQTAPTPEEQRIYAGLHEAAAKGDAGEIEKLIAEGERINIQDSRSRTPLHVAVYLKRHDAARALLKLGANANALEIDRYDIVTIAAVANDIEMLKLVLAGGASARNVTSRYDGTALIAAAHLGHAEVVKMLIAAKAPLNHVNNLGWTALMESIVLGSGGQNHTETLKALVEAGADVNIADRQGTTPLQHARRRGYVQMARILENAGAR
jgi:ankyrin repeat protein